MSGKSNSAPSLELLRSVIKNKHPVSYEEEHHSALFKACSLVAKEEGFKLLSPPKPQASLNEICSNANLRYRKIHLFPGWWKKDHGSCVAFMRETKEPVAILRVRQGRFCIIRPQTGEGFGSGFKKEIQEIELEEEAFTLYPPLPKTAHRLKIFLKIAFERKLREVLGIIYLSLFTVVLSFIFPIGNKILFDHIIPNYNYSLYIQLFLGFLVAASSISLFNFNRSVIFLRINGLLTHRLQISLWDRILRLPIDFFRKYTKGDLLQRSLIFEKFGKAITVNTLRSLVSALFSVLYFILMFFFSWQMALIGIFLVVIWSVLSFSVILIKIRYEALLLQSSAKIEAFLVQVIQAIAKIRGAALENRIFMRWEMYFSENQRLSLKTLDLQNIIYHQTLF